MANDLILVELMVGNILYFTFPSLSILIPTKVPEAFCDQFVQPR